MLLSCLSCNSKYLVNSADLKPNGRTVRCVRCGNEWFQEPNLADEISSTSSASTIEKDIIKEKLSPTSNLPSTYVKEQKPSTINSFLAVFFLALIIFIFWMIRKEGLGIIFLLEFYVEEFYFNLKLIISDITKVIHQILN